jgi:multiple sugar transport system substrate-binding protein
MKYRKNLSRDDIHANINQSSRVDEMSIKPPETTRLKMLLYGLMPEWTTDFEGSLKQKFEETHPDIAVNLSYTGYGGLHDEIVSTFNKGDGCDLFLVDNIWVPEFVEAGWLADVTEYITDEIKNITNETKRSVFLEILKTTEYPDNSGKYYAWPWFMDAKYLFYNKLMLKKVSIDEPPKTLDELWNQALTIKKKGIVKYPFVWSWAQQECLICDYIILTVLFGGRFVDETGKPTFHEGGAVKALEWMVKSIDAKLTSKASLAFTEVDVVRVFGAGDAAFALSWISSYECMNYPYMLSGACGISHVPGSDILPEGVSVNGAMSIGISSKCKNKDAAVELAKFWVGLGSGRAYAEWLFPTWMRVFEVPNFFREGIYNILDVVKYQYAHLVNRPKIPNYVALSKELQQAIHEALTKAKTPQKALNDAAKRLMAKGNRKENCFRHLPVKASID